MGAAYQDGFDTHTHLDFPDFDADREAVVERMRDAGVARFLIAGSDPANWDRVHATARRFGGLAAAGIHPWCAAGIADPTELLADLRVRDCDAIGELGLDTLRAEGKAGWEQQKRILRAQLAIARERDLPIIVHAVRAYPELLAILKRDGVPKRGGVMHAWTGHKDQLERALSLGLYVSFAAMITLGRARKALEAAAAVPRQWLLAETDCPNQHPPGVSRGEPSHLREVVATLAALRGEDAEVTWRVTAENAARLWPS
jgi:TatD DNase family protein